jgi:exonuclease III
MYYFLQFARMIMTVNFNHSDQKLARFFYHAHGTISQVNYRVIEYFKRWGNPLTPHIFDNCATKAQEIAYRALGPSALVGAVAILSKLPLVGLLTIGGLMALEGTRLALHLLAFSNQKRNYIHVRTEVPETASPWPTIATWNILGFPAGLNYQCGGCITLRKRFSGIAERIHRENPDILILQECLIDATTFEMFLKEFKDKYTHFFIHNGPNKWGVESGLLIMTKCAVSDYTFTPFKNNDWTRNPGFVTMKIKQAGLPAVAIIGTHMQHGPSDADTRKRTLQLAQIHQYAQSLTDVDAVILAGDLNIDTAIKKEREITKIDELLVGIPLHGEHTCTNEFNRLRYPEDKSPPSECVDQIALIKRTEADAGRKIVQNLTVVPVYNNAQGVPDSTIALSDHNLVRAELIW